MFSTILISIIFCGIILALAIRTHKSYIETKVYHEVKMQAMEMERQNLLTSKATLTNLIEQIEQISLSRQKGACNEYDHRKCEICTLVCAKNIDDKNTEG